MYEKYIFLIFSSDAIFHCGGQLKNIVYNTFFVVNSLKSFYAFAYSSFNEGKSNSKIEILNYSTHSWVKTPAAAKIMSYCTQLRRSKKCTLEKKDMNI